MTALLSALLAAHGVVHALRVETPTLGMWWVGTGVWLLAAALLVHTSPALWWAVALPALISSQLLVWRSGPRWRVPTALNAALVFPVALATATYGPGSAHATWEQASKTVWYRDPGPLPLVSEADLAQLPEPVARYLRFVGVVGHPRVWRMRASFEGELRQGPDDPWMTGRYEQTSGFDQPARLFWLHASLGGLPFSGLHAYGVGHATMKVRALSVWPVVDARSTPESVKAESVTFLNDRVLLAPATLIEPDLRWEPVDDAHVRVTWDGGGVAVSAELVFDPASGALVDFVSDDRSRSADGRTFTPMRWSTPVRSYDLIDGLRLPREAEAVWSPTGEDPFVYARFRI
ncbi:MAG: hypothetical protein H6735_30235, partial [Alphaproteobacteria bacterium]|nr:hypothetical protein [Alphaproteobacteria bacterium]